jgi:cell shape-determining protein MreC
VALGDKVFVYGKQCLDLKSVDYDAIAMLNVSATQELAKKVAVLETENAELKARADRLASLESENAKLKDRTGDLTARLEALEKSMAASGRTTPTTVALTMD